MPSLKTLQQQLARAHERLRFAESDAEYEKWLEYQETLELQIRQLKQQPNKVQNERRKLS
jgi:hypothetical protein